MSGDHRKWNVSFMKQHPRSSDRRSRPDCTVWTALCAEAAFAWNMRMRRRKRPNELMVRRTDLIMRSATVEIACMVLSASGSAPSSIRYFRQCSSQKDIVIKRLKQ
jgi:hypothetical protein